MANTYNTQNIINLPVLNTATANDKVVILGNNSSNTTAMYLNEFQINLNKVTSPPANSSSNGISGQFSFDTSFGYFCVSNNVWMRFTLSTW